MLGVNQLFKLEVNPPVRFMQVDVTTIKHAVEKLIGKFVVTEPAS